MSDIAPIRTALISVSNKSGIVEFARALGAHGIHILSTGGTARTLIDAGLKVTLVEDHTGFPEMLDGRVKTLHPKIHGGILSVRDNPEHQKAIQAHNIEPIDLVCIDLYPFERTIAQNQPCTSGAGVSPANISPAKVVSLEEAVEQIDIGGPSMLRSAAKNFAFVTVISDPAQYDCVLEELDTHKGTTLATRMNLAAAAYERTCAFDAAISTYLRSQQETDTPFAPVLTIQATRKEMLRYGENPHQQAALYLDTHTSTDAQAAVVAGAEQLHGKALSYNNLLDAAAALDLAIALAAHKPDKASACVIKHTNPCGSSIAPTLSRAIELAIAGDPMAAFGGIAACSIPIDTATATLLTSPDRFFEIIIAPDFAPDALAMLKARWKNVRLLRTGPLSTQSGRLDIRPIPGGLLVQTHDDTPPSPASWTHAAGPVPDPDLLEAAGLVEIAVRALSSNAVAIGGPVQDNGSALFGSGAGQMERVASCQLAVAKAGTRAHGAVAVSDAFFPFADGPEVLINAGISMLVHPGGSKRDNETFELCASRGVTCMTTGVRRFRH